MARLAISKDFLTEYAKLDRRVQRSVDQADAHLLQRIFARPFAAWRTFLHPDQRQIAYHPGYSGPAQVTGGPGTGKTVTVLHRAAFLAEHAAAQKLTGSRAEEFNFLAERMGAWLSDGIERRGHPGSRGRRHPRPGPAARTLRPVRRLHRARDHLYVSGTGQPSIFLPPRLRGAGGWCIDRPRSDALFTTE